MKTSDFNLLKVGFNYVFDQHKGQTYFVNSGWTPEETYETATYTFAIEDEIYFGLWSVIAGLSYDRFHPIKSEPVHLLEMILIPLIRKLALFTH